MSTYSRRIIAVTALLAVAAGVPFIARAAQAEPSSPAVVSPASAAAVLPIASQGLRPNPGLLNPSVLAAKQAELGTRIRWTTQFLGMRGDRQDPATGAAEMTASAWGLIGKPGAPLAQVKADTRTVLAIPLAFGSTNAKTDNGVTVRRNLTETASGRWDNEYRTVAKMLVDAGMTDTIIRIGWEGNGAWYPWAATNGSTEEYKAAYRHVVDVFRAASTDFRFDYTVVRPNWETVGVDAYPGDQWVDIISMDVYYSEDATPGWSQSRWDQEFLPTLRHHADFAAAHGKLLGYPEWAVVKVDEPAFVENFHAFMAALPDSGAGSVLYQSYFDIDNNKTSHSLAAHPQTKAAYLRLFGGLGGFGAGTTTTTVPGTTVPPTTVPVTTVPTVTVPTTTAPRPTVPTTTVPRVTVPPTTVAPRSVSVSIEPGSAQEGSPSVPFRVRLSSASRVPVTVTFATTGAGTATLRSDYFARSVTITIPAGETVGWVGVAIRDDRTREQLETFGVRIVSATGATIGTARTSGTIVDND